MTGISKGRGFQGVVNVTVSAASAVRPTVSTTASASRFARRLVVSFARIPRQASSGRMGGEQVKVLNLKVLKVIPENNLILVKGSIPGAKGSYLTIEK